MRGYAQPEGPSTLDGRLLPRGRPRAPPVRRPRARRGGGRDVHYQQSTAREGSSADSRLQDAPESSGEGAGALCLAVKS